MRRTLLVSFLLVLFTCVHSMFEREKGLNDWRIENLGSIKDLKFLENTSLVYTLSQENVLTLFDIEKQQIVWKKELPSNENFKLRYLSRNLLVYSEQRALLINSASHIIYDVQFDSYLDPNFSVPKENSGLAVEFFELNGHVYSVFAKDYKIITFRDYQQVGVQEYNNYTAQLFKPLGLIFDRPKQELILLAQIDADNLRSFTVNVLAQELIERDTAFMPKNVLSTTRTANYFALKQHDQVMFYQATDLMQQVFVGSAINVDFSLLDDVILIMPDPAAKPRFFNVAINKEEKMNAVTPGTCTINRAHESEHIDIKKGGKDMIYYTVQCKAFLGLFSLRTSDNDIQVVFKTHERYGLGSQKHGLMRHSFKSGTNLIVQLGDLSLHNIEISSIERKWSREESLSKIRQVEVIEQSAVRIESELEYVKNVRNPHSSASLPTRIVNRYKENIAYLLRHLQDLTKSFGSEGSIEIKESMNGLFGFKKVFLMLTDVGRLIALSSTDGKIQWAEYLGNSVQKIIVRNMLDREINEKGPQQNTQTKQIGVILHDEIKFLDPISRKTQSSHDLAETAPGVHRDFILITMSKSGAQFVLAIQDDSLENGTPLIAYPPEQFSESLMVGENIYFTHVDKTKGVISGYRLRKDLVATRVWSFNLEKQGEKILRLETQFQTASSVDHLHFTPTAFSGENIIYKHLDSNVFALATVNKNSENQLFVYLINGISGKVLHRYLEKRVRLDLTIDFVLSENLFILAFQRQDVTGLSHQEITVTELYSQRQEGHTKNLLMEYYSKGEDRLLQKHFSSFLVDQPVIVQESYVLPFTIKAISLTQTQHHITGKNLVVLTSNNQVYQVDHILISARRPHSADNSLLGGDAPIIDDLKKDQSIITSADLKNKELPPYDAVIPIISTKYISYGLNLLHLKEIKAFPTRLESTSQVLTYGFDVFFMRISPENQFDLLQEYFNYTLLFLFIGGLALSAFLVRNYASKQKRQTNFMML